MAEATKIYLSDAAHMVGKSESTVTRYAQSGKLSVTKDANGTRLFDVSELQRVFGDLRPLPDAARVQSDVQNRSLSGVARPNEPLHEQGGARADDVQGRALHVTALYEEKIGSRDQQISMLKSQLDETRQERDDWKLHAQKLQEENSLTARLLTDERDASEKLKDDLKAAETARLTVERESQEQEAARAATALETATRSGSRGRAPLAAAAVVLVGAVVTAAVLYPERMRGLLEGQGTPIEAAALEVVPEESPTPAIEASPPR